MQQLRLLPTLAVRTISTAINETSSTCNRFALFTPTGSLITLRAPRLVPAPATRSFTATTTVPPLHGPAVGSTTCLRSITPWCRLHYRGLRSTTHVTSAADEFAVKAPFLSDQVPLANGFLGEVEEILFAVGDIVKEGETIVLLETHKASLQIKAENHRKIKITEICVEVGQEVFELQDIYKAVSAVE